VLPPSLRPRRSVGQPRGSPAGARPASGLRCALLAPLPRSPVCAGDLSSAGPPVPPARLLYLQLQIGPYPFRRHLPHHAGPPCWPRAPPARPPASRRLRPSGRIGRGPHITPPAAPGPPSISPPGRWPLSRDHQRAPAVVEQSAHPRRRPSAFSPGPRPAPDINAAANQKLSLLTTGHAALLITLSIPAAAGRPGGPAHWSAAAR